MKNLILTTLAAFTFSTNVFAEPDYNQITATALVKLEQIERDHWAFKKIQTNEEKIEVSYFDPRKPLAEQWRLAQVNNQPPSDDELDEFNENHSSDEQLDEEKDDNKKSMDLSDMILADSIQLIKLENNIAHLTFTPFIEDMVDEQDKLEGVILLDIDKQQVNTLSISNKEALSPAFSVSLEEFLLRFEFDSVVDKPVIAKVSVKIEGTVGYFKSISESKVEEFSEYEFVGAKE